MVIHLQQMSRSEIIDLRRLKILFAYQEWLNIISNLVFGVVMKKNKNVIFPTYLKLRSIRKKLKVPKNYK
jgi:hypothetical protein